MTIEISDFKGLPPGSPANFPQMPTVGGDPVVESGSNSDGEWTRWADGAQLISASGEPEANAGFGGLYRSSNTSASVVNFPIAFISTPVVAPAEAETSGGFGYINAASPILTEDRRTQADVRLIHSEISSVSTVHIIAFGRWK